MTDDRLSSEMRATGEASSVPYPVSTPGRVKWFGADWLSLLPGLALAYVLLIDPLTIYLGPHNSATNINIVASRSNALNQLFWVTLFLLSVTIGWRTICARIWSALTQPVLLCLAAYVVLAGLSMLWSPVPGIALRRMALQALVILILTITVAMPGDKRPIMGPLLVVTVMAVLLNLFIVLITPPGPLGHSGIYVQKNELGANMAMATLFCVYGIVTYQGWRRAALLIAALMAIFILKGSDSKTSIGLMALLPPLAFILVVIARKARINLALLLGFGFLFLLAGWFLFSNLTQFDFSDLSLVLFHDDTFTGRTTIWNFVVRMISERPFLGNGFSSFWGIGAGSTVIREAPGFVSGLLQAHNGYLDVLIDTGIVGLIVLLALIVSSFTSSARLVKRDAALGWLCLTLILFTTTHNMLESSWFRGIYFPWFTFLLGALLAQSPADSSKPSSEY